VLSRLDYCNAVLAGLSESTITPLQRVQNAAIITDTKPSDHITPVLMHFHWLPIKSRILYKLCFLMHLIHTNQRPASMAKIVELTATSSSRLASGLPAASSTGRQRWKPSSVASLQSCRPCCLEQSPRQHSVLVKHQTFQETSQNLPVYIVILILLFILLFVAT